MWNFNDVKSLSYRANYVMHIVFDDALEGDVDFNDYIGRGPVFEPLRDMTYFRSARIENGTIAWPNGADVAPETLYEKIEHSKNPPQPSA